jgi:hypothetical protein
VAVPSTEVGLVIRYLYLRHREEAAGREYGVKARPCAIVVALAPTRPDETGTQVAVVPISHSPPAPGEPAIEIPLAVKQRLDLDHDRSWIVLSEVNRFTWPGPDLAPLRARASASEMAFGSLPGKLMDRVLQMLAAEIRKGRLKVVKRTQ